MSWVHRVIIVPAAYQTLAKSLASGIAPGDSAKDLLTTGLNASGTGAATHYVSSGLIQPEFATLLGDANATYAAAKGSVPLATIQAMYTASTIRGPDESGANADPFVVLEEVGLKLIGGTTE